LLYRDQTDETLVMLTLAGEEKAFEGLVLRYQKAVMAAAFSVTHNQFMAEDAAQDAFVTAWIKLDTLQQPSKFAVWACRIAKNCALNLLTRYRSFLPLEELENLDLTDEQNENPAELYARDEESQMLHQTVNALPQKVGTVIRLHYFEGLSVSEIAERMHTSAGTVKWQLHDGRKKLRKELCAMNETWNDTLVQRVLKKVEELKLWQYQNSKKGFETVYGDVLAEVEELPESQTKNHALADVLLRGWWWIPGEKNDALFERLKQAAVLGKNDDAMVFIVSREDDKLYGQARLEWIRDKQIPRLRELGFVKALAHEWFWLGRALCEEQDFEKGYEAYREVLRLLPPHAQYHAWARAALEQEQLYEQYAKKDLKAYRILANTEEYRLPNGQPRRYQRTWVSRGRLDSFEHDDDLILYNASLCDGAFTDALALGETKIGSDGTTLTFAAEQETVQTPAGCFEGCQLWITRHRRSTCRTWFKEGIGIVCQERRDNGCTSLRVLKRYDVNGDGLLPLSPGNTWEYTFDHKEDVLHHVNRITVVGCAENVASIAQVVTAERLRYDEDAWLDMIDRIRTEYWNRDEKGNEHICDVSDACARAEELAQTPMQKAHTRAACAVARRIMETDPKFNPSHTATGHWNFFARKEIEREDGVVRIAGRGFRWSFEWKHMGSDGEASTPLLFNDILGILQDGAGCLWSNEWHVGAETTASFLLWEQYPIKTNIVCTASDPITTAAGCFDDCIKLSLEIDGFEKGSGLAYRAGKKEYYFARGIGIVRTVNEYAQGARRAVYELTSYTGTGEGYMPISDGMLRRYDAQELTDGYVGAAEYEYASDEDGEIVIFANRTGIRVLPPPITQYSSIHGEVQEDALWEANRREESRALHDLNNFELMLHYLGRPSRTRGAQEKAVAWLLHCANLMTTFGTDGEVPPAWRGAYADSIFIAACATFGCKRFEEGYELLDRALGLYEEWFKIPEGTLLELGSKHVFGGILYPKGEDRVLLPDGRYEPIDGWDLNRRSAEGILYGMTAPRGWEWFNSVRDQERFKSYIERVKALVEQYQ